jgi:hypothetical protein
MKNDKSGVAQTVFKAFMSRHRGVVVFLGALIVFLTYVVNDTFRERYRSLADSIDAAENAFTVRNEFRGVSKSLKEIRETTDAIVQRMDFWHFKLRPGERYKTMTEDEAQTMVNEKTRIELDQEKLRFDAFSKLADKLPTDTGEEAERERLQADIELLYAYLNDWHQLVFEQDIGHKEKVVLLREKINAEEETMTEAKKNRGLLPENVDKLNEKILGRAREEQQSDERRSTLLKRVSIVLYVIGWGLGLVGKLYGADGTGGG